MTTEIDAFDLISGAPIYVDDIVVYPPTLGEIRQIGMRKYQECVSVLLSSPEDFLPLEQIETLNVPRDPLIFITGVQPLRDAFVASLSFFLHQQVTYSDDTGYAASENIVSFDQLRTIRSIILKLCCVTDSQSAPPTKFRNEKARMIYEKIQKRKLEQEKTKKKKGDPDMELSNLLSALCAFSPTYNLLNVWDLTIYQFYDQYMRLNNKIRLDVIGLRWAAWGKEDFDFSIWYKSPQNKQ